MTAISGAPLASPIPVTRKLRVCASPAVDVLACPLQAASPMIIKLTRITPDNFFHVFDISISLSRALAPVFHC
jgi:hypothetical protein